MEDLKERGRRFPKERMIWARVDIFSLSVLHRKPSAMLKNVAGAVSTMADGEVG